MAELEIHYADEWAALYVDGELDIVGDAYLTEHRAWTIAGVKVVHDRAFMRGQNKASGVARTVAEIDLYKTDLDARIISAQKLREQAANLVAQAESLERRR